MPNLWSVVGFLILLLHGVIVVLTQVMGPESLDKKAPSMLKGRVPILSIGLLAVSAALIGKSLFAFKYPAPPKKPRRTKVKEDEDDD